MIKIQQSKGEGVDLPPAENLPVSLYTLIAARYFGHAMKLFIRSFFLLIPKLAQLVEFLGSYGPKQNYSKHIFSHIYIIDLIVNKTRF